MSMLGHLPHFFPLLARGRRPHQAQYSLVLAGKKMMNLRDLDHLEKEELLRVKYRFRKSINFSTLMTKNQKLLLISEITQVWRKYYELRKVCMN